MGSNIRRKLRRLKQKFNELKYNTKANICKRWFKILRILVPLLLCAIIVEGAIQIVSSLEKVQILLAIMCGHWIWPIGAKLLNKVLRR